MNHPTITVVGSFAVGMTIRTDRMPVFGETLRGSDFDMGPGGKGSNQAVGAARLGASAWFAGIIGQDKLGDIAVDLYAAEGVNTRYLHRTEKMATGVGFIILNQAGENGIILDMSANRLMDAAFVDGVESQIARSDLVASVLEIPVEAAARAMALGRRHGVRTLLNPAPAAPLDESILQNVDVLTPNETELRILLGLPPDDPTPTPELAHRLQEMGARTVVVTMGHAGALILDDGIQTQVPGVGVEVVDTTGAGDAFNAGLAVALSEGRDLVEAVKFANCCGALACTRLGVIPALPDRQAVERVFEANFEA
ncbi:MAG: ribokinase [Chloroflexi bacterium]|nr:MAG: ribokinase [Chloroflexota bacterium]